MNIMGSFLQGIFILLVAPLLMGWLNNCRAWLYNKRAPGLLQPYRDLRKLFSKEVVLAHHASFIYRAAPYIRMGCMMLAAMIIPAITTSLALSKAADLIALAGLFGFSRFFLALAGMDIGTAFGTLGARREMFVASLAEPCLLMIFFGVSLLAHSTSLVTLSSYMVSQPFQIYHSLMFIGISFLMVLLAENSRLPVDNPSTHLELTMIHEAMMLEYSGRHLALMEWSSQLKWLLYYLIGIGIFFPFGIPQESGLLMLIQGAGICLLKLTVMASALACLEVMLAKMRIFRVTEWLSIGFLLAVLGILLHLMFSGRIA